jgi:hypothetical protein
VSVSYSFPSGESFNLLFPCGKWLDKSEGDKQIVRELVPASPTPSSSVLEQPTPTSPSSPSTTEIPQAPAAATEVTTSATPENGKVEASSDSTTASINTGKLIFVHA